MNLIIKLMCLWFVTQLFFWGPVSPGLGIPILDRIRPDRIIFLLMILLFANHVIRKEIRISNLGRIELYMVVFTLLSTISLIACGANVDSTYGRNKWLNALFNLTYFPFMTYFITKNIEYQKQRVKSIFTVLCIIGVYLSLTAMFEHFGIDTLVWPKDILDSSKGTHFGRVRGPFLESVAMGRVLTVCFVCFMFMTWQFHGVKRVALYALALLSATSIYFTYTRGPWVGFAAVLLIIGFCQTRMRRSALGLITLIMLVAIFGSASKFSLLEGTLFSKRQNTISDRIVSYKITLKMAHQNPIFGIGFGKFHSEWPNYFSDTSDVDFGGFDGSHNTYLTMLAELGIIGSLSYLLVLLLLIRMCLNAYKNLTEESPFEKALVAVTLAVAVMYILTGFVSDLRWSLLQNCLAFLFFGLVSSMTAKTDGLANASTS